jgi:murein DD-endopeptidase MepM/ murein hydrolase activator NlpD
VAAADPGASATQADDGSTDSAEAGEGDAGPTAWVWPVAGEVTSGFGPRWGRRHTGVDIAAPHGAAVVAAAAGEVTAARSQGGYGLIVTVGHPGGMTTAYAHLSAIGVATGDTVAAGQRLGAMGCSGSCTGTHVHFELRRDGTAVDPRRVLP